MTRYAVPGRCPACSAPFADGSASCGACGLPLRGQTALRLYQTLAQADALVAMLRAEQKPPAGAPVPVGAPWPAGAPMQAGPPWPPPPGPPPRKGISTLTVPRILLGLGAACLLVAALVFLAVTWSLLGVGGRTVVLVLFTVAAGALARWAHRRRLAGATEAFALVGYGLFALDLIGAEHAGWFGGIGGHDFVLALGLVLLAAGGGGALLVVRDGGRLASGELVAALGAGLSVGAASTAGRWSDQPALVVGTCLVIGVAWAAERVGLRVLARAAAVVALVSWGCLAGVGLIDAFNERGWRGVWGGPSAWLLLAAAAIAAAPALVPRLPIRARVSGAAVGHLLLACALLAPAFRLPATALTSIGLAVLALASAAMVAMTRRAGTARWAPAHGLTAAVAALGLLVAVLVLTDTALDRLRYVGAVTPSGSASDRLPGWLPGNLPAPWLLPLLVLVLGAGIGAAIVVGRALRPGPAVADPPRPHDAPAGTRAWPAETIAVLGAAALAAAVVLAVALYPVLIWVIAALLTLAAAGFAGWWQATRADAALILAGLATAAAIVIASHARAVTGPVLLTALAIAVLAHLRSERLPVAIGAGVSAAALTAAAAWTWLLLAGAEQSWAGLGAILALGVAALSLPYLPDRWWHADARIARAGFESGAAVAWLALAGAGVEGAAAGSGNTWAGVYLTAAGTVVTIMSLLRSDRRWAGWPGGALLVLASWVRLWDVGVRAPEPYTLPAAAALLIVGLVHLRRDPTVGTARALGPGLGLALTPSLLWVLADPGALRTLLLGLACLALALGGARVRWSAPVVAGAAVGAVLVLRLVAPVVGDVVPQWILLGLAGVLLLIVGVSWEQRVQEVRRVGAYLARLR